MKTNPIAFADKTIITNTDGKIVSIPVWGEFPSQLKATFDHYLNQFDDQGNPADPRVIDLYKNGNYRYTGSWSSFYVNMPMDIYLVHFVTSGHVGWHGDFGIYSTYPGEVGGITTTISRAYDVNVTQSLTPVGRYGFMTKTTEGEGPWVTVPDWFVGSVEVFIPTP